MTTSSPIPVIDLFAGPGGLGEGFSSIRDAAGHRVFQIGVSIEKDDVAHRTLSLRAFFRSFPDGKVPDCYYDYVRGDITRRQLFDHPQARHNAHQALEEAHCAELGKDPSHRIDGWIRNALDGASDWALIGGPPCQAYSLAGRSRLRPKDPEKFENDKRHFLYTEYLRIIRKFAPSVFVMENVKGMLNSKHKGSSIFTRILSDLTDPGDGLTYNVRSLVVDNEILNPYDYVIEAERFGIPQARHRVILFGVRSDVAMRIPGFDSRDGRFILKPAGATLGVRDVISDLPKLRSRLSREPDSPESWLSALAEATRGLKGWNDRLRQDLESLMARAAWEASQHRSPGAPFVRGQGRPGKDAPDMVKRWFHDPRLGGILQHETRSHMRSDLHRYLFAAAYARLTEASPKIPQFPPRLLPEHENMDAEHVPFLDRFRVQIAGEPSTTVVSHIAKDGHYYIHYDPAQCRSLTVREAARLQTFPDNYFFEGTRTQQYTQVGNAVPPLLAQQIAKVVFSVIQASKTGSRRTARLTESIG